MSSSPVYGQKSDIFSLGCVIYELCELKWAYNSFARTSVPPVTPSKYSEPLRSLVADCMKLSPASRISTSQLATRTAAVNAKRLEIAQRGAGMYQPNRQGGTWQQKAVNTTAKFAMGFVVAKAADAVGKHFFG